MARDRAGLPEIARAKLIGYRDDGRSHDTIFMGTLSPGHAILSVNPNRKTHAALSFVQRDVLIGNAELQAKRFHHQFVIGTLRKAGNGDTSNDAGNGHDNGERAAVGGVVR